MNSIQTSPTVPNARLQRGLRLVVGLGLAAVLAACSSGVKLDDVPVENRTGSAVNSGAAAGGQGGAVDPRGVSGVAVGGADSAQPAAVARIIYFDYDSFEVKADSAATLEANARYLNANRTRRVNLEGHTDERGGREYNLALGQKRAEAVAKSLGVLGAGGQQVEAVSFGEERPIDAGHDEAAWAKNRRAELKDR